MNARERLLAMAVGGLGVLIAVFFLQSWIASGFTTRRAQIQTLEKEVANLKKQVLMGRKAQQKIAEFEERSLPPKAEVARSVYHDWLLAEAGRVGMAEQDVRAVSTRDEGDLYVQQTFSLSGRGTLAQTVDLLHAFYSVNWLHRIKRLSLKPVPDSKLLDISMTIDALSLKKAPETNKLEPTPSNRLALSDREAYRKAIVERNLFSPANQPPKLSISGSKEIAINRRADITAKATDADPLDKLSYRLVKAPDEQAKIDPESGRLSWTPKATGKYEFVIEAADDGLPSRTTRETLVLNVIDPPPEVETAPRLSFDHAKFTVLSAVLDVAGQGEVWLYVRPTGQTLKLHEGESFEVGSVKGKVAEIGLNDFHFDSDGKRHRLSKGGMLDQAQEIGETTEG